MADAGRLGRGATSFGSPGKISDNPRMGRDGTTCCDDIATDFFTKLLHLDDNFVTTFWAAAASEFPLSACQRELIQAIYALHARLRQPVPCTPTLARRNEN